MSRGRWIAVIALAQGALLSSIRTVRADDPQLLLDIASRTVPFSFDPELTPSGGFAYFRGSAGGTGLELWRTDGKGLGTGLVRDIFPGPAASVPSSLTSTGSLLVFTANDGEHGAEIWSSDGTPGGTLLLADIAPGARGANPSSLTALGKDVYFVAGEGGGSSDLWRTDGTPGGTLRIEAVPEFRGNPPSELTAAAGLLFFSTGSDATGAELWASDGTPAGTRIVEDIAPGKASSFPSLLEAGEGTLWFRIRRQFEEEPRGYGLWKSDGSGAGTLRVRDFGDELFPVELAARGSVLYMGLVLVDDDVGELGGALWKSDGTEEGTVPVKDLMLGSPDSPPRSLTFAGDRVLFVITPFDRGDELWSSQGTEESTVRIFETPGRLRSLVSLGETILFVEEGAGDEVALHRSDGTRGGTVLLRRFTGPGIILDSLTPALGGAVFGLADTARGREIWFSDGSPPRTRLIQRGFGSATESSFPEHFTRSGPATYFVARKGSTAGDELWRSDGTEPGTLSVKEVIPPGGGRVSRLCDAAGTLFLSVITPSAAQLWKSDGTRDGTGSLIEFAPDLGISELVASGSRVFFHVGTGLDSELWTCEAASDRPRLVLGEVIAIAELTDLDGTVYFITGNQTQRAQLWKSNGTPDGTVPVKSFEPDPGAFILGSLVESGGEIYFLAGENTGQRGELWKSDGTGPGTVLLRAFSTGTSGDFRPFRLVAADSTVYLFTYDGFQDGQLWKTNGTRSGTVRLGSFGFSPFGLGSADAEVVDGTLYFQANEPGSGAEIWRSDGTSGGTRLLSDLNPGEEGSDPAGLVAAGETLYFSAFHPISGRELWKTDGTSGGTMLVEDIHPGAEGSNPGPAAYVDGVVYVAADDGVHGVEPWAFTPTVPPRERGDSNADTRINISDPVYLLLCLFLGDPPCPGDPCASDINADGEVNLTDPIFFLDFLFRGGPSPPPCV